MATTSAESLLWDRVAGLRPRLRPHARIHRHYYRGRPWYVLQDRASTRHYRFSAGAYQFIALLDGRRTVEELWRTVSARLRETAPSQEHVVHLLAKLRAADLLQYDKPSDAAALGSRWEQEQRHKRRGRLLRPLAIRFALLDPERALDALLPLARPLFGGAGLLAWILVVGWALLQAASHWPELLAHGSSRTLDPRNLLLMGLAYPVIKAMHELGHAIAVKAWGGEVHEMGIMLLVLMPVPYVDASAASAFPDKRRRMMVGAAGILVEMFLAAVGMLLWLVVEPGLVRDIAFDVALIGGVSTLLFNGNPLLRFDGYYVLADAIEVPNLGPRSTGYYGYLAKRYLLGLRDARSPVMAPGESGWLLAYGITSYVYRLTLTFTIALLVAGKLFVVGVILAVWAVGAQVVYPLARQVAFVLSSPMLGGLRARAVTLACIAVALLGAVLHWVPVPSWTQAEGVIRLPEHSLVRAGTDGFIMRALRAQGEVVEAGDVLFELDDPALRFEIERLEWRRQELEARQVDALIEDRVGAEIIKEALAELQAELDVARQDHERLTIRSPTRGTFTVTRLHNLPGRFARKGDLLGHVVDPTVAVARVVVPQTRVDLVRRQVRRVEARLPSRPGTSLPATMQGEVPSATEYLPSKLLGTRGGGAIAVDTRDAEGTKAIDPVFQFDVSLPPNLPEHLVGGRVYVRFEHDAEPLTRRWGRRLRQLFLARLRV